MKLLRVRVTDYKSIDDSGWVAIDDVTCLVGKNESGKTAFLHALKRLSPLAGVNADFDLKDYPRKGYVRYKRSHKIRPAVVVRAELELSEGEMGEIESAFGAGILGSPKVIVSKDYKNRRSWEIEIREGRSSSQTPLGSLPATLNTEIRGEIISGYLERFLPRFVYFDDYSAMRGRISIQELRRRRDANGHLEDADRAFLSVLAMAGVELEDLENETNYENLKAELESASIGISDEVFEFWRQNRQLRVEFDLSLADPNDPPPLNKGTILHVRIWNDRHRVSVPFDERSKGFVWFFSFLSYFSQLEEEEDTELILLLDEPGLNLHAMAQQDFLRFIDERLAPKRQVVYTTHSPFMINLGHLDRIRTVEDTDDAGTVISSDMLDNDRETVFPLQVALGSQMAQTLLLAPHCLMVNASSDLIYLQVLGEVVASGNRPRLDPRWVVIPVGGAENLPTFVSLLGESYVSVAVLMDVTPKSRERIEPLNRNYESRRDNPIRWVEVARIRDSDIEDLLDPDFYLKLVNMSYARELPAELTLKDISGSNPRIVQRMAAYFQHEGIAGGHFDPYTPAAYWLLNHARHHNEIGAHTIERAASLFERINSLLPTNGAVPSVANVTAARTAVTAS